MKKIHLPSLFLGAGISAFIFFGDLIHPAIAESVLSLVKVLLGESNINFFTYIAGVLLIVLPLFGLGIVVTVYTLRLSRRQVFYLIISYFLGFLFSLLFFLLAGAIATSRFKGF